MFWSLYQQAYARLDLYLQNVESNSKRPYIPDLLKSRIMACYSPFNIFNISNISSEGSKNIGGERNVSNRDLIFWNECAGSSSYIS